MVERCTIYTAHTLPYVSVNLKKVPVERIRDWVSHSDIRTTTNIYGHLEYQSKIGKRRAYRNLCLLKWQRPLIFRISGPMMAERVGFEPTVPLQVLRISSAAPSTKLSHLSELYSYL